MYKETICDPLTDEICDIDKYVGVARAFNSKYHNEIITQNVPEKLRWDHLVDNVQLQDEFLEKQGLPINSEYQYTFNKGFYTECNIYKYHDLLSTIYGYYYGHSACPYSLEIKVYPNIVCNQIPKLGSAKHYYPCKPLILRVIFSRGSYTKEDTLIRWQNLFITQPDIVVCD